MDDLIKRIYDKYIEDFVALIELQKILSFLIYLSLSIFFYRHENKISIWLDVTELNFKDFFDINSQLWSSLKIGNIVLSSILTLLTSYLYMLLKTQCYKFFSKIRNMDEYIYRIRGIVVTSLTGNKEVDLDLVREWSKDLPMRKRKLVRMHIIGEVFLSIMIGSTINIFLKKSWLDLGLILFSLVVLLFIQWQSYLYFIRKVLPIALPRDLLFGSSSSTQEIFLSSNPDEQ